MARVCRRLDEFSIERGLLPEDHGPTVQGADLRDEVIRVAAELRRGWLEDAGSLEELFAQATPTKRGRPFGRKAPAQAAVKPVDDGSADENAETVRQRLAARSSVTSRRARPGAASDGTADDSAPALHRDHLEVSPLRPTRW